jgi:hypothetical protein
MVANVIDADITVVFYEDLEVVRKVYGASTNQKLRNTYVYDIAHIDACISNGRIMRPVIEFKRLGGRRGECVLVTIFSAENLCHYYFLPRCMQLRKYTD